jgi:hypothetical protein
MAHFASLDENNKVLKVHVVANFIIKDGDDDEQEQLGIDYLNNLHPEYAPDSVWKQTSYNGAFRKNYAGVDYTYDNALDAFIPPKRKGEESFVLNEDTCQWEAPIPYPDDGKLYVWNELMSKWAEEK